MSSNTFGKLFAVTTFGESHGPAIGCVVDGCPPGLALEPEEFATDLARRATGKSRHTSQRHEEDAVDVSFSTPEIADEEKPPIIALLLMSARTALSRSEKPSFRTALAMYASTVLGEWSRSLAMSLVRLCWATPFKHSISRGVNEEKRESSMMLS